MGTYSNCSYYTLHTTHLILPYRRVQPNSADDDPDVSTPERATFQRVLDYKAKLEALKNMQMNDSPPSYSGPRSPLKYAMGNAEEDITEEQRISMHEKLVKRF